MSYLYKYLGGESSTVPYLSLSGGRVLRFAYDIKYDMKLENFKVNPRRTFDFTDGHWTPHLPMEYFQ